MSVQPQLAGFETPDPTPRYSLFFALWPDDATRARIERAADAAESTQPHDGRRLRPHRFHLTLRWLGEWPRQHARELDAASAAAEAACAATDAFEMSLDIAGGFAPARVCWLGCDTAPTPLHALRGALDRALLHSGVKFRKGQALVPHVTVARDCRRPWDTSAIDPPIHWQVDRIVLIRSDIQHNHAYTIAGEWPLSR
ncbi:RNA 2',3'-cyclic phosphodiesterase [Marilutibacter maris]|uniref:RNA 2',3'-cyclic phosphodiesterase n=1 Tax=Marilutibacter maris TaxID=1605891 RepID=UPI000DA717D0|nr:RNA 2',3'-cyclic phosphodiesterase [Lysobacter maris]